MTKKKLKKPDDPARLKMGSKPFRYGIKIYQERKSPYLSPTTVSENVRKLNQFASIFEGFVSAGKSASADPRHIGEREIELFLGYMRSRNLSATTRRSYIKVLRGFLLVFRNNIIDEMKANGKMDVALKGDMPAIEFMSLDQLQRVFDAADEIPGYEGTMIRGFIALIFGIAGRPKEIIEARMEDLNLEEESFYVRHPKGEGSYGSRQWIPIIRKDMIPRIRTFLDERKRALEAIGITSPYLFTNTSSMAPYGLKTMRTWKGMIEVRVGFKFKLKSFRSSYATITYSFGGIEIKDAISKQMRHSSTQTTETYYIAYEMEEAKKRLTEEWKKSEIRHK